MQVEPNQNRLLDEKLTLNEKIQTNALTRNQEL